MGRTQTRPTLPDQQRDQAKAAMHKWQDALRLGSQVKTAEALRVEVHKYGSWIRPNDRAAGPVEIDARNVDRAYKRLECPGYEIGDFCEAWGWTDAAEELREEFGVVGPDGHRLSLQAFVDVLHEAGFNSRELTDLHKPVEIFWVHSLRPPNVVHGVFTMAAAAATRAGVRVQLVLDDAVDLDQWQIERDRKAFMAKVGRWFEFAHGVRELFPDPVMSSALAPRRPRHSAHSARAFHAYLNQQSSIVDLLLAAKAVSPSLYVSDPGEAFSKLMVDPPPSSLLKKAVATLSMFERGISSLREQAHKESSRSEHEDVIGVVTLGGLDEQPLWQMWDRGAGRAAEGVRHLYLDQMRLPNGQPPWRVAAFSANTEPTDLGDYLQNVATSHKRDLISWLMLATVGLPAALDPEFRSTLDPTLRNWLEGGAGKPTRRQPNTGKIARAVTSWLGL